MGRWWWLVALLAGCNRGDDEPVDDTDAPGPLVAGIARARIPAPLGIGTAGFGPFGASNKTPFADLYPGTKHIFGHPEVKVVVLSRGVGHEAVFVRLDAVGVFSQLRQDVVIAASDRVGHDLDDALLLGATHTHSGPGRLLNTGDAPSSFFNIVVDVFHPEFYERFIDAIATAIDDAFADARAARLGSGEAYCADAHDDRRCEDGEVYENGTIPMLAVERDGELDALVMAYAIHGTALNISDLHLSQDVSGAIETAVEDRFDSAVMAVMFDSWGADMSPGNPTIETRPAAERDANYDRMWRIGDAVAAQVEGAWEGVAWSEAPTIDLSTHRAPIDRETIGYEGDLFDHEWGAVYCTAEGVCEEPIVIEDLDERCAPFNEASPAPRQTEVTVGQVGDFALVTFPGEPGTRLSERLMDGMIAEVPSLEKVFFMGYTQDYLGYSILEDDWWHGGYEASGAIWGPRQGEYIESMILDRFGVWAGTRQASEEPAPLTPFPYSVTDRYVPDAPTGLGTITSDVPATVAATDVLTFAVQGTDPWLGAPRVVVVDEDGALALRPNGAPLDSDDQNFDVSLTVDPPYADDDPPGMSRTFTWTWRLSPRSPLPSGIDLTGGPWRLRAVFPDAAQTTVDSAPFTVSAAE